MTNRSLKMTYDGAHSFGGFGYVCELTFGDNQNGSHSVNSLKDELIRFVFCVDS